MTCMNLIDNLTVGLHGCMSIKKLLLLNIAINFQIIIYSFHGCHVNNNSKRKGIERNQKTRGKLHKSRRTQVTSIMAHFFFFNAVHNYLLQLYNRGQ